MQRKIIKSLKKIIAANVWYHGRTVKSQVFDEEKTGKGNDQEGPGFYFSSDYDDASRYAYPSGIVMTANIDTSRLTPKTASEEDIEFLLDEADPEDLETSLSNWSENTTTAREMLIEAIMNNDDPYLTAWYEIYRYEPAHFLKAMVKLGYDGHIKIPNQSLDIKHLIVYNPDVIEIQKVEDYQKG